MRKRNLLFFFFLIIDEDGHLFCQTSRIMLIIFFKFCDNHIRCNFLFNNIIINSFFFFTFYSQYCILYDTKKKTFFLNLISISYLDMSFIIFFTAEEIRKGRMAEEVDFYLPHNTHRYYTHKYYYYTYIHTNMIHMKHFIIIYLQQKYKLIN